MENQNLNQAPSSSAAPADNLVPQVSSMPTTAPTFDQPKKKSPIILIVVILLVALALAGGLYLYSTQVEKLSSLNNQTQYTPPTPLVQESTSPAPTLQSEADSIVIEDPESDFTALDADLSSL